MKLKGMDKLREKLPGYPGRRIFLLPLRGTVGAILAYSFLILLDILPRLYPDIAFLNFLEPLLPVFGSLIIGALTVFLIAKIWKKREPLKEEFGNLAYQRVIPTGAIGVMLIPAVIFHAATSIRSLPPVPPVNPLTIEFSQSLLPLLGITGLLDIWIRFFLAGFFILVGILIIRSAVLTFGIDYMTVVYLYFPEESEMQEHEIYSVVRHPTYMAAIVLGGAAMFFRCSVYSMLIFIIGYLIFRVHLLREEAELIDRFGEGYREYKKKVPGLYVRPRDLRTFIRFLKPK
jgi:protein-S-isoprenylcysteine O-methyltransferase Ste14